MSPEPTTKLRKATASAPATAKGARKSAGKAARSGTYTTKAAKSGMPAAKAPSSDTNSRKAARGIGKGALAGGGTTKISVTVPTEVLDEVRSLGPDNLSAIVADALRQWSASARLGRMFDELDAIYGPVPADVAAEVETEWGPIFDRAAARRAEGPEA